MRRPGREGGAGAAESVTGVLGLRHADGSPVTLEDCRAAIEQGSQDYAKDYAAVSAALRKGEAGAPVERAALADAFYLTAQELEAWRALEKVALAMLEGAV